MRDTAGDTSQVPSYEGDEVASSTVGARRRRSDIEGLRAIAVGAVVAYHAGLPGFSGGFVGVDVFFVISGYLITERLFREAAQGRGVGFAGFYARRIRRVLPMATVTIVGTLVAATWWGSPLQVAGSLGADARSAALFVSNVRFAAQGTSYLGEAASPSLFQQFWSLSLEEQFYFIWPAVMALLVLVAGRIRLSVRAAALGGLGLITAVTFLWSIWASRSAPIDGFFLLQFRAWELGVGGLLAVVASLVRPSARTGLIAAACGLVAMAVAVNRYSGATTWPGLPAALPVLGTTAVIAGGLVPRHDVVERGLALAPMQAIGRYSYSIYLLHWPLILLLGAHHGYGYPVMAVAIGATLVLAAVSYHLVEDPVRGSTWLRGRTNWTLVLGASLVLVAVAASVVPAEALGSLDAGRPATAMSRRLGEPLVPTDYVPSNLEPSLVNGTNEHDPNAESNISCASLGRCNYGDPSAPVHVVLFGDSHAGEWGAAFERLATANGWYVQRLTTGGCSSFDDVAGSGGVSSRCLRWLRRSWQAIDQLRPDVVVMANRESERYQADSEGFAARLGAALERVPPGTRTVLLSETPAPVADVPECLADHLDDTGVCEPPWPNAKLDELNATMSEVAQRSGAEVIDLGALLCTADRCPVVAGNILVYRDDHHLTSAIAAELAPDLNAAISQGGQR